MSDNSAVFVPQQEDEKKNKKKQSPVDDRPVVPAPSEAMLNSEYLHTVSTLFLIYHLLFKFHLPLRK